MTSLLKKKKKKRINVLIFDLKVLSSQHVHKLTETIGFKVIFRLH